MAAEFHDMKHPTPVDRVVEDGRGSIEVVHGDTAQDQIDMLRLGKKQEFKRNFSFISTLGFVGASLRTPRYAR